MDLSQWQELAARALPDWQALRLKVLGPDSWRLSGLCAGQARSLTLIARGDGSWRLLEAGNVTALRPRGPSGARADRRAAQDGIAPMDGVLRQLAVSPGQCVSPGQLLYVIEAMKMQLQVSASVSARVAGVHTAAGARVRKGDILVSLEVSLEQEN